MPPATKIAAQTLRCSHCGAPQEIRGGPRSRVLVCQYCDSAMDLTDPNYRILWRYSEQAKFKPFIPLGKRGRLFGETLECIGFMRRSTVVDGIRYGWSEHLLYNPYKGYRWLVEDGGQWSLVRESMALPTTMGGEPIAAQPPMQDIKYAGRIYKQFQTSNGRVDYALGEFYWQITVGQETRNTDYVSPPYILSAEISDNEITWSCGQHLLAQEVRAAFNVVEAAPEFHPVSHTVGANEPNPVGPVGSLWVNYFMYVGLAFLITMLFAMTSKRELVFHQSFPYYANQKERSFVTDYFDIGGRPATLQVQLQSSGLDNRWVSCHLTLINDNTNEALDFGEDNESYHGVDDGEAWYEGNINTSETLPHIVPGKYYLRVEPESGTYGDAEKFNPGQPEPGKQLFTYTISAWHDVAQWGLFWIYFLFLLPIPVIQSLRSWSFESRRWANSVKA